MTSLRTITVAVAAAVSLVAGSAMAQEKAGGAPGAPAAGAPPIRPPEGAPAAGAARPASPGMAPAGKAEPAPGTHNAGENVGESPKVKPAAPGAEGNEARPPAQGEGAKPEPTGQPAGAKPGQAPEGEAGKPNATAGKPNGAARPAPQITSVQQTRIQQSFKSIDVHPVNVTFNVAVGVGVPAAIALSPLPPAIIGIVPGYESFRYFIVPGEIVIVDPVTLEIVAVLPL